MSPRAKAPERVKAAWERDRPAPPISERCRGCRRPEGAEVIAWRTGYWGTFLNGALCLFTPSGDAVTSAAEVDRVLASTDFRPLTVQLVRKGGRSLCPRCAHTFPRRQRAEYPKSPQQIAREREWANARFHRTWQ